MNNKELAITMEVTERREFFVREDDNGCPLEGDIRDCLELDSKFLVREITRNRHGDNAVVYGEPLKAFDYYKDAKKFVKEMEGTYE